MNHTFGEIDDFYWFTHIEDKDLSIMTHRPSLNDKLSGFWNQHEISDYIRVSYRYWPTCADLFFE
ncbi:Uncharacterised protein [Vibrio cholerae]|uniref:V.cholerae, genes for rfbA-rfbT, ompX, orf1-3 n=1 Tax=Vibrio cholerae TaxID=666 RepID=Q07030_VIBCL|nr:unnamed protein product [Vibrio cholerae]CSB37569.1 Uncharacterised protein [Vibrio cholerae]CSC68627.1 Uncharacterised protein [Vibrio cholerae]